MVLAQQPVPLEQQSVAPERQAHCPRLCLPLRPRAGWPARHLRAGAWHPSQSWPVDVALESSSSLPRQCWTSEATAAVMAVVMMTVMVEEAGVWVWAPDAPS